MSKIFTYFIKRKFSVSSKIFANDHQIKIMSKGLPKQKPIEGVKNIILVASAKGGVGKSTTAVNLALGLKSHYPEKQVGILDTDLFGPTVPLMMNLDDSPLLNEKNLMIPLVNYGIKCMSMGFLIEKNSSVIWRGLMVMSALDKLFRQVYWEQIDFLIIDSPPGTGDTQLSLLQNIPINGVVLVTTPQEASLQVTRRGISLFKKLNIPIIGLVENMSCVICPQCSTEVSLSNNRTSKLAEELEIKLLESIPFDSALGMSMDRGNPLTVQDPSSLQANAYHNLAKSIFNFFNNS